MDQCELRVRIRLYVPLSSSLSDSTNVSRVDEATYPSFSLPFLSLPLSFRVVVG